MMGKFEKMSYSNLSNTYLIGLVILMLEVNLCRSAKILGIFPAPYKSHFNYANAVMKSLIEVGHEVTVITPFAKDAVADNYSSIIDISEESLIFVNSASYDEFVEQPIYSVLHSFLDSEKQLCELVINSKAYQDLLSSNSATFDVIFVEIIYLYKCLLPIAKKLNIPVIGVSPLRSAYYVELATRNAHHPADVPFELITAWQFDKFYHRLMNIWSHIIVQFFLISEADPFLQRFHQQHEDILGPHDGYLEIEPVLSFYNGYHAVLPKSQNPNVIEIGGIQMQPAKHLSEKILKFIDGASNGVIVFTFGSFVKMSTLPVDVIDIFLKVFASIPQRVIWKFESPLEDVPENVMLLEWLPQRDILEHPNVKAFISHCGQGGVYEAIYTATPVIACPLMYDQFSNAAILQRLGVAVRLDIHSVSTESVLNSINLIINDTSYFGKMQKISKAFKNRPLTPQQSVVFWTEYVMQYYDVLNLSPPSSKLNWFQYYLFDALCLMAIIFVFIAYLVRRIVQLSVAFVKARINSLFGSKNKLD